MYEKYRAFLIQERSKYARFKNVQEQLQAAIVALHNADLALREPAVLAQRLAGGEALEESDRALLIRALEGDRDPHQDA